MRLKLGSPLSSQRDLPVDDAGLGSQMRQGLYDQRKTVCEIIAGPSVKPHAVADLARDNAKTVVLNLMQPSLAQIEGLE